MSTITEIKNMAGQYREIKDKLGKTWGTERKELEGRLSGIERSIESQVYAFAKEAHDRVLAELTVWEGTAGKAKAEIAQAEQDYQTRYAAQLTKYNQALDARTQEIEKHYEEHFAKEKTRRKQQGLKAEDFRPLEFDLQMKAKAIENADRDLRAKYITAIPENVEDQERIIRDLQYRAKTTYGDDVDLFDKSTWEPAANRKAVEAERKASEAVKPEMINLSLTR